MQCKGQGYMILIDRYQLKLYSKSMSCPCKCPHVILWIRAYLSKKNSQSIIHFPPFLGPLPLVDINLMLAFGPSNSPPLASNTKKEDISSTREGQIS